MSVGASRPTLRSIFRPGAVRGVGGLSVFVAVMMGPVPASADAVSDAKDLFTRGREMRRAGDCSSAIWAFHKAYELYPEGLGSLRNVAECEEALGRFASSRRDWLDLRRALGNNPPDRYDGWARDAEDAAARLAPKLSTLRVDVTPSVDAAYATRAGIRVRINDEALVPAMFGTPLERDPGHYVVRVGRPGAPDEVRAVDLGPGEAKAVSITIPAAPVAAGIDGPAFGPADRLAVADDRTHDAVWRTVGWTALGVGAASLTVAGVSWLVRQSALDDLKSECPGYATGHCPASVEATVNRGATANTLVEVFGVAGLAAAVGGGVLVATHFRRGTSSPQAAAVLSPSGAWVAGRF